MNKKIISFLILAFMMLSLAVSCTKEPEDVSETESQSSDASDVSEISEPPFVSKINPLVKEKIDEFYTGNTDKSDFLKNVTEGCSYDYSVSPSESYSDTGKLLTNRIYGDTFYQRDPRQWIGLQSGTEITVDLGETIYNLVHFETSHCFFNTDAIRPPLSVMLYVSNDGESFTHVGNLTNESIESVSKEKNAGIYKLTLTLSEEIKARYIKYKFNSVGGWLFMDEVAAYTYDKDKNASEGGFYFYSDNKMPEPVETEEFWDSSENDYKNKINLLKGLKPQIMVPEPNTQENFTEYLNTPQSKSGMLTDGIYADEKSGANAPEYFHSSRALARTFVFDLTKLSAVEDYKFSFYVSTGAAITAPKTISIYASENATDWYLLKNITGIKGIDSKKLTVEGELDKAYRGRFIAVTINIGTHTWCDELEITGTKDTSGIIPLKDSGANKASVYPNKYISPDNYYGVHDVALMYNEKRVTANDPTPAQLGMISEEETLSYVAYLDRDGTILDYMFDSFLYLPFAASSYCHENSAQSWITYMDNTFAEGYNLDALNAAVATSNAVIGNSEYKAKVFLSILRPLPYERAKAGETIGKKVNFGSLGSTGSLDFMKEADRQKAIQWQIDEYLRRWEEKGYQNLELIGFYWYEEDVSYNEWNSYPFYDNGVAIDESEMDITNVKYASEYTHEMGFTLTWIPWYKSTIYFDWSAYGIDVPCMQPNFFWNNTEDWRIIDNASITKRLGMCIELECDGALLGSSLYRQAYKKYLKGGIDYGYMTDCVHMYYMSGGPGLFHQAAFSKNEFDRSVYDDTYKFIKGILTYSQPEIKAPDSFSCKVNTRISGNVEILTETTFVKLAQAPKYGTVELKDDGSFTYTPFTGFGGEDTFYVIADNDYLTSELLKIVIDVNENK